ncbi:MAG: sigma-70 family RNA polymerase sigma factor [Gammaproteobacteria bacterium]|nr:sigma-70 family RNA polymerase sigma factor [Gammaproteobacteria bacterium]
MPTAQDALSKSPEALVVGLARTGDRDAFAELVRRRQSWIRTLMRRCCDDITLADDLAQQVFLQAWRDIKKLRQPKSFGSWLRRLAINVLRQHLRTRDALRDAEEHDDSHDGVQQKVGMAMDLNHALAKLSDSARLCVVLSYHEGMSHGEIASFTKLPVGTVKSHIRRGSERLQQLLSAYQETQPGELI